MTEEEKDENDWKFTNYYYSRKECKYVFGPVDRKEQIKSNNLDHFECPVCDCVSRVRLGEMHRYTVMDDGTEIRDY